MNKQDQILINRLKDLANRCYSQNYVFSSDFLNLYEQNIFISNKTIFPPINNVLMGGNIYTERKIAVFYPEYMKEEDLTAEISALKIEPAVPKFAEPLNHRDYLGSMLGLGIDRGKIGDIFIDENTAYCFVKSGMTDFIISNLTKVKHTFVKVSVLDEISDIKPTTKDISGTVSSIRLDSISALAFNSSRSGLIDFIESGHVFVNGKLVTSNAYNLKEDDIVSFRGKGRYKFISTSGKTKKNKFVVNIQKYI